MRIIVTGGAGFIGYHLTKALMNKGHSIIVYDNMSSPGSERIRQLEGVELIEADVLQAERLREACLDVDVIYHLAGQSSVPSSMEEPRRDFDSNVHGTVNALEAAKHARARFIFTSSATVYGPQKVNPTPETAILSPISFYGLSKMTAEKYCGMYSKIFHIPVTIFRVFNAYGPHCHGVIYDILRKISKTPERLNMLGTPDGSKDFIYISDVVDALTRPLQSTWEVSEGVEVYNVGSGRPITIGDLTYILCEIAGLEPTITFSGSSWKGDVTGVYADVSKISTRYGWRPSTGFREGLKKTAAWFFNSHLKALRNDSVRGLVKCASP